MKTTVPDGRARARRALRALERAKRASEATGVALSDWEGDFLQSVEARVNTFGRAFADPAKGAAGEALSILQGVKLKEISAKAKGKARPSNRGMGRSGLQARRPKRNPPS